MAYAKKTGDTSRVKQAKQQLIKSGISFALQAILIALIANVWRKLIGKEDEEDTYLESLTKDLGSSVIGNVLWASDIYNYFVNNYDISNFGTDGVNLIVTTCDSILSISDKIVSGEMESDDLLSSLKSLAKGLGTLSGIPVRNVFNLFEGAINTFGSSSTQYKYEALFNNPSASSIGTQLKDAIETGDTEKANTIIDLYYGQYADMYDNTKAGDEIRKLYFETNEIKVLPNTVPSSITYNEETYELTESEYNKYKKHTNEQSYSIIDNLLDNDMYQSLDSEIKADLINSIFNYQSAIAKQEFLENRNIEYTLPSLYTKTYEAFNLGIDIDMYYVYKEYLKTIESDKDEDGNIISGSKKAKNNCINRKSRTNN